MGIGLVTPNHILDSLKLYLSERSYEYFVGRLYIDHMYVLDQFLHTLNQIKRISPISLKNALFSKIH